MSSGFDHVPLNKKKVRDSSSGNTLELKVLSLSGDLNELRTEVQSFESISNKRNDAHVPIICWMYWLNRGRSHTTSSIDWGNKVWCFSNDFSFEVEA